ncbi:hypothetical protein, partial [Francisella tularensis]|uniref:hypothetical protein n=1 Tax=Francisella tularensis TaxID=263 RepID=UPI002381CBA2
QMSLASPYISSSTLYATSIEFVNIYTLSIFILSQKHLFFCCTRYHYFSLPKTQVSFEPQP